MNIIYGLLNKAATILSEPATLTKTNGTTLTVYLTPEAPQTEAIGGADYPASQNEIVFSVSIADLTTNGSTVYPAEGDVITGQFGAPSSQSWKVITDGETATAWKWQWGRPGERIVFKALKISAVD